MRFNEIVTKYKLYEVFDYKYTRKCKLNSNKIIKFNHFGLRTQRITKILIETPQEIEENMHVKISRMTRDRFKI